MSNYTTIKGVFDHIVANFVPTGLAPIAQAIFGAHKNPDKFPALRLYTDQTVPNSIQQQRSHNEATLMIEIILKASQDPEGDVLKYADEFEKYWLENQQFGMQDVVLSNIDKIEYDGGSVAGAVMIEALITLNVTTYRS